MFYRIAALKNLARFAGKHTCGGALFSKVVIKKDSNMGDFQFPVNCTEFF